MPHPPRPTTIFPNSTTSARQPNSASFAHQQSSALSLRIAAKRSELENLKQLRDLSGALATQMGALEEKLATLRNGTEAVACVLANWDHVLRAISMASMKVPNPAKAVNGEEDQGEENKGEKGPQLPVTLVRIPAQSQDTRDWNAEKNGRPS